MATTSPSGTNFDPGRPRKKRVLILDLGEFIKPVITPDDIDQVKSIVEARRRPS